jgi:hypothetical protein
MVAVAALLDTLSVPSANGMDKVYCQLKDILGVAATHQAERSLQRRVEVSISSPYHSKGS